MFAFAFASTSTSVAPFDCILVLACFAHNLQVHDAIIPLSTIPAIPKSYAGIALAECDKALCEGGDEELQLLACCIRVREAMTKVTPA